MKYASSVSSPFPSSSSSQSLSDSDEPFDLLDALSLTANSDSTDIRDKVFGILGFLDHEDLLPNYSTSTIRTFIGVFLHSVLAK